MQTRFVGLNEINDLVSCILQLGVLYDDEISASTIKLTDKFEDFKSAEVVKQLKSFKILFAS